MAANSAPTTGIPHYDHIVVVVEENHTADQITANAPYINSLTAGGASLTNYSAVSHPSEPNYLALYAGDTMGVTDDASHSFTAPTLASQLQAAGKTFTGYVENGSPSKHNPWESFGDNVAKPMTDFPQTDFSQLPNVSFVIPNLDNDMHDGSVTQGDSWLRQNLGAYAQWAKTHNSLLVVTTDEDDGSGGNNVLTTLSGVNVKPGTYADAVDHYSLLRTIAAAEGVTAPGQAATATPLTSMFTSTPIPPPSPAPIPTPTPPQGNYITPGKGSFTDAAGNVYRLDAAGNANENGNPVADGSNTAAMQYADGQVYGQDAASHSWYTWNQTTWTRASAPPAPTPTPPPVVVPPIVVPSAPPAAPATDTLQLSLSEDAWQGDAQAFVTLDGKQIGGMLTVTASHAQGKVQTVTLTGQWGPGAHDVGVQFVNDAYGGTTTTDRNLYVGKITLDGQASAAPPATLYSNGTAHLATAASPLVLQLSEDAWQGDAQFAVAVDGKTLGAEQTVTALHAKGAVQDFAFGTAMAAGTHDVAVSFLNDAYGGTATTDRNLYVNAVDANGKAVSGTAAALLGTSTQHFAVVVAAHL